MIGPNDLVHLFPAPHFKNKHKLIIIIIIIIIIPRHSLNTRSVHMPQILALLSEYKTVSAASEYKQTACGVKQGERTVGPVESLPEDQVFISISD
jgi:hypothetical protein